MVLRNKLRTVALFLLVYKILNQRSRLESRELRISNVTADLANIKLVNILVSPCDICEIACSHCGDRLEDVSWMLFCHDL